MQRRKPDKKTLKMLFLSLLLFYIINILPYSTAYAVGQNIILNPGFEEADGSLPSGWSAEAWPSLDGNVASIKLSDESPYSGQKCIHFLNIEKADSKLIQQAEVAPGKTYRISAMIKVSGVKKEDLAGANIVILNGIYETPPVFDTEGQWQKLEVYVEVPEGTSKTLDFAIRLGGFGTTVKGEAWVDDVEMIEIEKPPKDVTVGTFFGNESRKQQGDNSKNTAQEIAPSGNGTSSQGKKDALWIIPAAFIAIITLIIMEARSIKKPDER